MTPCPGSEGARATTKAGWGLIAGLLAMLLASSGCERAESPPNPASEGDAPRTETALEHARRHLDPNYVCPMHPQIVKDEPGSCPLCGMDLVAVNVDGGDGGSGAPAVTVGRGLIQALNIQTTPVRRGTYFEQVHTVGRVAYDESGLVHVHPRAEGWVERLEVRTLGEAVTRGQTLLSVYSPEIVAAQEEWLSAQDARPRIRAAARDRLRLLNVPDAVVARITRSGEVERRVPMPAPITGVVTRIGLREGMFVTPTLELFVLADLSTVWVLGAVYEPDLTRVRAGLPAEVRLPALPGERLTGRVDYVYPALEAGTRTAQVRVVLDNPERRLKPGMLAEISLFPGPRRDRLLVPASAVIRDGRSERAVVRTEPGRFRPVPIQTAPADPGRREVLSGLAEGDHVVVSGQFLIDAESSLRASARRLSGARTDAAAGADGGTDGGTDGGGP